MIIHQHLSIFAQARDQSRDQHRSSIARYISRHKYERTSFAKFIPKRKTSFADKCSNDDNTHSQAKATADAFLKLRAKVVIDISNYGPIIPEQILKLEGFIKPTKPNKKRNGKRALSFPDSSAFDAAENMFAGNSRK